MRQPTAKDVLDSTFRELKKMLHEKEKSKHEDEENLTEKHTENEADSTNGFPDSPLNENKKMSASQNRLVTS